MGGVISGNYPNLYDKDTGLQIGYVTPDGKEFFGGIGGLLSNVIYGTNGPTSWTEGTVDYTATYNSDGTLATVTGGGSVKTFTYSAGQLTGVTTGAV